MPIYRKCWKDWPIQGWPTHNGKRLQFANLNMAIFIVELPI